MRLSDENLRGRAVIAADGQVVGAASSIFINNTWSVESLLVKLGKDIADQLGVERTMFHPGALEIPVRMIQSVGDTIVLSAPLDALRQLIPLKKKPDVEIIDPSFDQNIQKESPNT
jgi:sporulation protein YlmC with PRC-barrel domain